MKKIFLTILFSLGYFLFVNHSANSFELKNLFKNRDFRSLSEKIGFHDKDHVREERKIIDFLPYKELIPNSFTKFSIINTGMPEPYRIKVFDRNSEINQMIGSKERKTGKGFHIKIFSTNF